MNKDILILQASPRIEIVFYEHDLEVRKIGSLLMEKIRYDKIKSADFIKGKIPWFTGAITTVIDLMTGHGVGQWKRGKGSLDLATYTKSYNIELVNYDREQISRAIKMINEKV